MARGLLGQAALVTLAVLLLFAQGADASVIVYNTPSGSVDKNGDPVSAQATVSSTGGVITVTLKNTLANPTNAGQLLSDFGFTLAVYNHNTGQEVGFFGGTGTLDPSTAKSFGILRTVFGDRSFTFPDGSPQSTHWALENTGFSAYRLCDLCAGGGGPQYMIIGDPNPGNGFQYTNANDSIKGPGILSTDSGPDSPFLAGVVQFTINIAGITSSDTADVYADSVFFSFGLIEGDNISGQCIVSCLPGRRVPEPASLLLLGAGIVGLWGLGRRTRRPMK